MTTMLVLLLVGCGVELPIEAACQVEEVPLARSEVSTLGFSADDVVAWYGDEATLDAAWVGRHSRTPEGDTIDITLGDIDGDVTFVRVTPYRDTDPAMCVGMDELVFERTATFATRDGQVAGAGTMAFRMTALGYDGAEISGVAYGVTLAEQRWAEVELALEDLGPSLAPSDEAYLAVGRSRELGDRAEIGVDGEDYLLAVWKCDEQHRGECALWR